MYRSAGVEATYRNSINDVAAFLTEKHGSKYMIINVSEKSYEKALLLNQVCPETGPRGSVLVILFCTMTSKVILCTIVRTLSSTKIQSYFDNYLVVM